MIVLGIDLETTGLDTSTCSIIEVGAVLWENTSKQILRSYSSLIKTNEAIPEEITEITGITQSMVDQYGTPWQAVLRMLQKLQDECDYLVGHNAREFDAAILAREGMAFTKRWIDTKFDLPFPEKTYCKKNTHLAADLGFVNPFPHRALTDILTTLKVLSHYDETEVKKLADLDNFIIIAQFNKPDKADPYFRQKNAEFYRIKEFVKVERGFKWIQELLQWRKIVKTPDLELEKEALSQAGIPFRVDPAHPHIKVFSFIPNEHANAAGIPRMELIDDQLY